MKIRTPKIIDDPLDMIAVEVRFVGRETRKTALLPASRKRTRILRELQARLNQLARERNRIVGVE